MVKNNVLLNELQLAHYETLMELAVEGVVDGEIVATYKQNVINALLRRGVIKRFRLKHYKFTDVPVSLKPPHVSRQAKNLPEFVE